MQAQQVSHKLLNDVSAIGHQVRRAALETTVMAALTGTRLTVTDLGRSIDSQVKQKHYIKRADRLLSNPHFHSERPTLYANITQRLIGNKKHPTIIVDWSDMDGCKRHFL